MNVELLSVIPMVIGIVAVIKMADVLPTRFLPLAALVIAVVITCLNIGWSALDVLQGIIYGLSSSGLYSGTRALTAPSEAPPAG